MKYYVLNIIYMTNSIKMQYVIHIYILIYIKPWILNSLYIIWYTIYHILYLKISTNKYNVFKY